MEEVLKIKITGDVSGLDQSSAQSIAALNNLQSAVGKAQGGILSLSNTLKSYGNNAGVISQSSKQIADGLRSIQASAKGFSVKPVEIKTNVDTSTIINQLNAATRAVKINIDAANISPVVVPIVADTDALTSAFARISNLNFNPNFDSAKARLDSFIDNLARVEEPLTIPVNTTVTDNGAERVRKSIEALRNIKIEVPVQLGVYQGAIDKLKVDIGKSLTIPPVSIPPIKNPISPDFKKKTVDASNALINLGRVAQDAPYGFIGIANNLNPVLEGFQQLSKIAKDSGQSVKSVLLKSLTGAGGLGLGLSLVTAALGFASIGFAAWTRGMGSSADKLADTKKRLQDAKQALQDYVETLGDVPKFNLVGTQNAQDEIVRLQTLYRATQNANIPLAERRKLVDELQSQYPKYFKNIADETILAGGAEAAYKKLSTAILQSARARAGQDAIVDIQKQLFAVEEQHAQSLQEQSDLYQKIQTLRKNGGKEVQTSVTGEERLTETGAKLNKLQQQYNEKLIETSGYFKTIIDFQNRSKKLADDVQGIIAKNGAEVIIDVNPKIKEPTDKAQFNFFDKFFDVKPAKDQIEKQFLDMYETARDFAEKNSTILVGLEPIINAPSRQKAIEEGRKFWEQYQKGFFEFKIPVIKPVITVDPQIDFIPGKSFSELFAESLQGKTEEQDFSALLDRNKILADFKTQFAQLGREIPKTIGVPDPITGIVQQVDVATEINVTNLINGLTNAKRATIKQIEDLNESITNAMRGIAAAGFGFIGDAIAGAITGGGIGDAFARLGSFIGESIQKLGEQMIALSPIILAIQAAIKSFNPALLLPAGIALTALGGVIKSAFANSLPGLEQGGIIPSGFSGDTYFARLNSGEAVIPLDQLWSRLGDMGGGGNVNLRARLRGSDIHLSGKREERSRRRRG